MHICAYINTYRYKAFKFRHSYSFSNRPNQLKILFLTIVFILYAQLKMINLHINVTIIMHKSNNN